MNGYIYLIGGDSVCECWVGTSTLSTDVFQEQHGKNVYAYQPVKDMAFANYIALERFDSMFGKSLWHGRGYYQGNIALMRLMIINISFELTYNINT